VNERTPDAARAAAGPARADAPVLLQTRALEKRFGGVIAVSQVDFTLHEGEIRCLIGPNGAGKSTFFKMLSGQLKPSAGEVLLAGENLAGHDPFEIARRGVGIKNQVPDVMNGLTVRENLWLAAHARRGARSETKIVDELAERVGIGGILDRLVGELAHGQRQWVEIASVIATDPRLILLDEPAAGMTDEETVKTAELIRELNRHATIVVVEHDMQFIQRIARRVTVFHQGRVLVEGSFDQVVSDPVVRDVYLGRDH
jgi:branched-chain amino acid transport system ATP-binding protein/urea transport system ATP-binding protein